MPRAPRRWCGSPCRTRSCRRARCRAAPAISFSAAAISSACARLSSWHGPAISASGSALPKRTLPTVTTGFGADMPDLAQPCRRSTRRMACERHGTDERPRAVVEGQPGAVHCHRARRARHAHHGERISEPQGDFRKPLISVRNLEKFAARLTGLRFEHERRAVRGCGPTTSLSIRSMAAPSACARAAMSRTAKRIAASRMPRDTSGGSTAKCSAESGRVHHLDLAARRLDRDAARGRLEIAHAGKRFEEDVMVGRVFGDEHHAGDAGHAVGDASGTPGFQKFSG